MDAPLRKPVSRRTMLKIIAAAGGGTAASFALPGKWVKPFVRAGVLPVHAQTSQAPGGIYSIIGSSEEVLNDGAWYFYLSVTISPALAGVTMYADYRWRISGVTYGPTRLTGTTDDTGMAEFPFSNVPGTSDWLEVVYSFADGTLCSTNCTRTVTPPLTGI